MNFIYWILVMCIFAPQMFAAEIGLYDISDGAHLKPFRDQIGEITISSQSNDNKHYYLALRAAHFFSLPCEQIGLIVGGNTIRFESQGQDSKGRFTSMETTIDDPEVIPQIAQFFHAKIIKRRHPGNRMLVQFIPDKAKFTSGESVMVKLRITNIGDSDFAFVQGGRQRGPRNNQFAFSAELISDKMIPDTGSPITFGGLAFPVTLKAGESHEIAVDLTKWFDFRQTGEYRLRGSYYMEFIEPGSHDLYTIWDDYACAEFTLEIKGREPTP